ncbi:hypothetical protein [Mesorhizobium sp. KR9-304]|uniref:hypothetical protein n=1 Tax=Mesorhizobium sp. KR9-304 TaxID=3156614 RepID=UPI0032B598AE
MSRATPIAETVTLHVPFRLMKRGGRKEMHVPDGAARSQRTDSTLIKALARAYRWKQMLESGDFATIADLARHEGIAPSYLTRILRLTFLAPDIIEAVLEAHTMSITAEELRTGIDDDWDVQRRTMGRSQ